ncbi:MAG: hypothetical protein ABIE03_01190 [Patescibacteria group bacterium]|nr:hypothetical protein [Patescibacteria group bacterium]
MRTKILVKGMFCEACCKLIRTDIEKKFRGIIYNMQIIDPKKRIGKVELKDVTERDIEKVKGIINGVGVAYKVIESC